MYTWRGALVIGLMFILVGVLYFVVQGADVGTYSDRAGATMLVVLGIAMAFVFTVLLRGSREL